MWYIIAESIPHFLDRYGLLAIFAVMLVKEIGVPLPIPGDLIMLSAAARSASGQLVLWQAFLAILVALVVGDWIQFALARSLGRPVLDRFGRYIGLTPARLDRASAGVGKGGIVGVAVAIITPGVRNVTSSGSGWRVGCSSAAGQSGTAPMPPRRRWRERVIGRMHAARSASRSGRHTRCGRSRAPPRRRPHAGIMIECTWECVIRAREPRSCTAVFE